MGKKKGKIKKFLAKVTGGAKSALSTAALIPLMPAMLIILKARKLPVTADPKKNALTIYNEVIKKDNYEEIEPVLTTAIITAVIGFFRDLAKKKKEGKLSKEENPDLYAAADVTEKAEKEIEKVVKDEVKFNIGDFFAKYGIFIILGIAAIIFIFLSKKK